MVRAYPHELSGGMRQRVAIAAALAPGPKILIADEPTTALDVTTQAGILELLATVRANHDMSMVLITHDLFLAREYCDDLAVFQSGRVVESGPAEDVFNNPRDEVTKQLVEIGLSGRRLHSTTDAGRMVLAARGITKTYPGSDVPAVADAGLDLRAGEIIGVVGSPARARRPSPVACSPWNTPMRVATAISMSRANRRRGRRNAPSWCFKTRTRR